MSRDDAITQAILRSDFTLTVHDPLPFATLMPRMLACRRCGWAMRHRFGFWSCENWRPWNFWRHDLMRRTPTHTTIAI